MHLFFLHGDANGRPVGHHRLRGYVVWLVNSISNLAATVIGWKLQQLCRYRIVTDSPSHTHACVIVLCNGGSGAPVWGAAAHKAEVDIRMNGNLQRRPDLVGRPHVSCGGQGLAKGQDGLGQIAGLMASRRFAIDFLHGPSTTMFHFGSYRLVSTRLN